MRHNYKGRKLGTDFSHTKAMKKSLVNALFLNDRIKTVESRAKEIRPNVDKIITWAKKGDLHSRRLAIAALGDKELVREIFEKVEQGMFADRQGGYTRIMKLGNRKGDNAPLMRIELVMEKVEKKAVVKAAEKTAAKAVADEAEKAAEAATERAEEAREEGDLAKANEAEEIAAEAGKEADAAEQIADYLMPLGFNLDFAPVADVVDPLRSDTMGLRSFSSDAAVAADMVRAEVEGFRDKKMLCCMPSTSRALARRPVIPTRALSPSRRPTRSWKRWTSCPSARPSKRGAHDHGGTRESAEHRRRQHAGPAQLGRRSGHAARFSRVHGHHRHRLAFHGRHHRLLHPGGSGGRGT